MDETTPHIHATIVPIVTGERRKAGQKTKTGPPPTPEDKPKKQYRKKSADSARLCADDVMARPKLKTYQDTYAQAMRVYGLQRGIEGSEAKHIPASKFYRELFLEQDNIKKDVEEALLQKQVIQQDITHLQEFKTEAEKACEQVTEQTRRKSEELGAAQKELEQTKREIKTDKLKGAAVEATAKAVGRIGSFFHDPKPARYEKRIETLENEKQAQAKTIADLKVHIQTMQTDHAKEISEKDKETETLRGDLKLIYYFFPYIKQWLGQAKFLKKIGFAVGQIKELFTFKPIRFSGKLYSHEFKMDFETPGSTAHLKYDPQNMEQVNLHIDGASHVSWFREKRNELYSRLGIRTEQSEKPRQNKGLKPK